MEEKSMENLNFDDGLKRVTINGDPNRVLKYNPGDMGILDRMQESLEKLEEELKAIQNIKMTATGNAANATQETAKIVHDINISLRESFDNIFYPGASDVVFGNMNPLALANGHTIYENFMLQFADLIKPDMENEVKKAQEHIQPYKESYDRMPTNDAKD